MPAWPASASAALRTRTPGEAGARTAQPTPEPRSRWEGGPKGGTRRFPRLKAIRHPRRDDRVGETRIEPRIVDGDGGMVRQRRRDLDVAVVEPTVALVDHLDDADRALARRHR